MSRNACGRRIDGSISKSVALGLSSSALLALAIATVPTSDPVITVRASADPGLLAIGEEGTLQLEIDVPAGWHLWSLDPGPGPQALAIEATGAIELFGDYCGDASVEKFDRGFNQNLLQYEGTVRLQRAFKVKSADRADVLVRGQICTDEQCVSQKQSVSLALMISEDPTGTKRSAEACR